jgi:hypothetical protein
MAKITIFECFGTLDTAGITTQVKGTVDPDLFTYVPVTDYPNSLDNYGNSVSQGVASVLAKVAATPGKIVLTGVSQGAQIMGNVYNSLKTGPRAADIVGVYLVGNPIRQAGRAFPGANPIPAGHGVAPAQYRMTNTPDLVWEMANPGDPVCTIGDDAFGLGLTTAFGQQMQNLNPASADFLKNITAALDFSKLIVKATGIGQGGIINAIGQIFAFIGFLGQPVLGAGAKHSYFDNYKPIAGDPRSGRQIICDHLNLVIGPQYATAPAPTTPRYYGLVNDNFTPRLAAGVVKRWNDGKKRHTVYTACGTGQDGWGLVNLSSARAIFDATTLARQLSGNPTLNISDVLPAEGNPLPNQMVSFDAAVGRAANPDLFNWVPISYPAAQPGKANNLENEWEPKNNSLASSARTGVNELIQQIKATPGTFALVGMSQGSVVISQVLKAMQPGGPLAGRYGDCIAGLAYGNPCRKAGTGLPGVAPVPGAGLISLKSAEPMASGLSDVTIPSWWWEFSTPGDITSDTPFNNPDVARLTSPVIQSVFNFNSGLDLNVTGVTLMFLLLQASAALMSGVLDALVKGDFYSAKQISDFWLTNQSKKALSAASQKPSTADTSALTIIGDFFYKHIGVINVPATVAAKNLVITPSNYYPNGDPHIGYGTLKPPSLPTGLAGVNSNSTYVDIGIAYLNARGAAVAPR